MNTYPNETRTALSLSGWEGAGKSQGVKHISEKLGFFIVPEIARVMFPVNDEILGKPLDELSEQTFSGYVTGHHICVANRIRKIVQDRCILDPLTYQALYSPEKQLNIDGIKRYIDNFTQTYDVPTLLDTAVLIRHPKDEDYIARNVFSDSDRQYSNELAQYKADALRFEELFQELYERLPGVTSTLKIIDAYPENQFILKELTLIAAI